MTRLEIETIRIINHPETPESATRYCECLGPWGDDPNAAIQDWTRDRALSEKREVLTSFLRVDHVGKVHLYLGLRLRQLHSSALPSRIACGEAAGLNSVPLAEAA